MVNEVLLEGLVVRSWTYASDLFYSLASYRDPGLPPKPRGITASSCPPGSPCGAPGLRQIGRCESSAAPCPDSRDPGFAAA